MSGVCVYPSSKLLRGCQQRCIIQCGPDIIMVSGYRDTNLGIDFRIIWRKEQASKIRTYGFSYDLMSTSFMPCSTQHIILQIQILRAVTRDGKSEKSLLLSPSLHLSYKTFSILSQIIFWFNLHLAIVTGETMLRSRVRGLHVAYGLLKIHKKDE